MGKNDLSRKGVFGSIWRWLKGKMFSSYKLSLNISSNMKKDEKDKMIKDLVKKIKKWNVSYYPLDRINAILQLGVRDASVGGNSKVFWYDLDENQQTEVRSKLVGFINRICYGDYTGGPSNSKREETLEGIYSRTDEIEPNPVLKGISVLLYNYSDENKEKLRGLETNSAGQYYLWTVSSTNFDDGMGGKYANLLRKYAKPADKCSGVAQYDIFLDDMDGLLKNPNYGKNEIYELARKEKYTSMELLWIRDKIELVNSGLQCKNYDRSKDLLTIGIKLLEASKGTSNDPLKNWYNDYENYKNYIQLDRYEKILQVYYLTHPGDYFLTPSILKYNFKDKNWVVVKLGFDYYGLFIFNNTSENLPSEYVYTRQYKDKLIEEMEKRKIKISDKFKELITPSFFK